MTPVRSALAGMLLLALAACGEDADPAGDLAGAYALDRGDFARRLAQSQLAERSRSTGVTVSAEERDRIAEAARAMAAAVDLRLDLLDDGTFVVRYRMGKEDGQYRGSWVRDGGGVRLETTHSATGPVTQVEPVTASRAGDTLEFAGWPVPHSFSLRRR